jgi:putative aldouronate transport system permease protein
MLFKKVNKPQNILLTPAEKKLRDFKHHWQLYLFLLYPMFALFLFIYLPLAGSRMAFQDFRVSRDIQEWIGLKNFTDYFTNPLMPMMVGNTLRITLYSWITNSTLTVTFALLIHAIPTKGFRRTVQSITCLPHFLSTVVVVAIMTQIFNPAVGLYGSVWRMFNGGVGYPTDLLGVAKNFNHFYNWSGVWQALGWGTIMYIAALTNVDPNLHEAAMLDGANRFQRLIHLDMPVVMPLWFLNQITAVAGLLSVGWEKILLMRNGTNAMYSLVLASYTYNLSLGAGETGSRADFSLATAVGVCTSVISLTLLLIANKISKELGKEAIL